MPDKILAQPAGATEMAESEGDKADDDDTKKGGKLLDKFRKFKNLKKSEKTEDTASRYTMIDIFRNRHLTINTLCMSFLRLVFTALHCMQRGLSYEHLSVCPSVRPSVKRVNCDKMKAPSEKSSIMTNRKSPTSFPMSLR